MKADVKNPLETFHSARYDQKSRSKRKERKKAFSLNLSLIPADVDLAGAEVELIGIEDSSFIMKRFISKIKDDYDFIIINSKNTQ